MIHTHHRILILLLLVALLPLSLLSCGSDEAVYAAPALTVKNGELTLSAGLDASTLQRVQGGIAYLYELAPGEAIETVAEKAPILSTPVQQALSFHLPLEENGSTRLYHSYVVAFSDGTLLTATPLSIRNPQELAVNHEAFPHASTAKALSVGRASTALALHANHAVASLSLGALLSGQGFAATFNGITLQLDSSILADTDAALADAARHGQQITLALTADADLSIPDYTLLLDALLSRYSNGEYGNVSAICLEYPSLTPQTVERSAAAAAELLRITSLALRSRFANGRVYLGLGGDLSSVRSMAISVHGLVSQTQRFEFGIAFLPEGATRSLLSGSASNRLCLSDLVETAQELSEALGRSTRFAVMGLKINTQNEALGAALYTYAYRAARLAKAELVCYRTVVDDQTGLYGTDLTPRMILHALADADTSENTLGEEQAAALLGEEWTSLQALRADRVELVAQANHGTTENTGSRFLSFSGASSDPVFTSRGSAGAPTVILSSLWNDHVLSASIRPDVYSIGSGFSTSLADSRTLSRCQVLSANLLAQSTLSSTATVTLLLDGTAADGRPITCSSSISLSCNGWQAVSFHIRSFTAQLDPSAPCTLTLLMETDESSADDTAALFLHSLNSRAVSSNNPMLTVLAVVLLGFTLGFTAVLLLSARRKRRSRRA